MSEPNNSDNIQTSSSAPNKSQLTEVDLKRHSQELGMLGWFFGSKDNAPYYIAAVAIIISLGLLCYAMTAQPQNAAAMTLLGSIITGALGYIFGRSSTS